MGAGGSKPEGSSKHVFASDTPVQFSQELVDSLQASSETDSTRHKSFDLQIAQRVAEELSKIEAREQSTLDSLYNKISSASSQTSSTDSASNSSSLPSLLSDVTSSISPSEPQAKDNQDLSSPQVLTAIQKLEKDLSTRKTVKEIPEDVEKARGNLVSCLRLNDRRPLDCWAEVDGFKKAVGKLEEKFVEGVL